MINTLPIRKVFPYLDPVTVFDHFADEEFSLFLDSSDYQGISIIAIKPFDYVICRQGHIETLSGCYQGNPWELLENIYQQYYQSSTTDFDFFQGGLAGFLGYEMGEYLEKLLPAKSNGYNFPDCALGLYDLVMVFDQSKQSMTIVSQGWPEILPTQRYDLAEARIAWLLERLKQPLSERLANPWVEVKPCLSQSEYCRLVERAIEYIYAGDIFEVNLSQRFFANLPKNFDFYVCYQLLRQINPAPFSGFFRLKDHCILSASPERFLQLKQGYVSSKPIKGTRRRAQNSHEDQRLAEELLASEKDRAENVMIVDLLRNDLSKVCDAASVRVDKLCALETFANVHHLVSTIEGKLRLGKTAIDLLKATFPGGSITGAPKIRSQEIITELEHTERGPYCGSLGYIGFHGEMDFSILIRSMFANKDKLYVQAGGAIVADSDPEEECQETYTKAARLLRVLLGKEIL